MSITGLNQVASRATTVDSSQNSAMGKDEFLRLLVAQLQAQDPLNPMNSTEFTAQLAQFSSLEQLQNINGNLDNISTSQSVMTNSQAVSYIGKSVKAIGNTVTVKNGSDAMLNIELASDAAKVFVGISDSMGNFVRDLELSAMPTGSNSIEWDGNDYLGNKVQDGAYSYEISAIDSDGNAVTTTQYISGVVTGVTFENGKAYLLSDETKIPMGNVISISQEDTL